jgi:hypothetical protein
MQYQDDASGTTRDNIAPAHIARAAIDMVRDWGIYKPNSPNPDRASGIATPSTKFLLSE